MKILRTSNYDLVTYPEMVVAENLKMEISEAWAMCRALNDKNPDGPDYYCPVDDDYIPHRGMEDLI